MSATPSLEAKRTPGDRGRGGTAVRRGIDSLPRPPRSALKLAADYWTAPDEMFRHLEGLGDRFVIDLPGLPTWVCTTNPDDVKSIFTAQQGSLRMGEAVRRLTAHEPAVGAHAMIFKDGPEHLHERRTLAPAFHGDRLTSYQPAMIAKTEERLAQWPTGEPVRFGPLMAELTLDVMIDIVFGVTDPDRIDRLRAAIRKLNQVTASRLFLGQMCIALLLRGRWLLASGALRQAVEEVDGIVLEEIAARRRDPLERDDFLTSFLEVRDDNGDRLSDPKIAQTLRGLLLAGHETTSATLTWLAERVVRHPAALDRLETSVAAGDDSYVDATIAETLRLRPIAPFTGRWVVAPFELGDVTVPPGKIVVPFITLLHRRPELYPDPMAFKPERFLDQRPGTYTWIPFGGGAHRCLGGAFTLVEMRAILRTILQHRRFAPATTAGEPAIRHHFGIAPAAAGTITLRRIAA
jgi:cytochrome P450 family 135